MCVYLCVCMGDCIFYQKNIHINTGTNLKSSGRISWRKGIFTEYLFMINLNTIQHIYWGYLYHVNALVLLFWNCLTQRLEHAIFIVKSRFEYVHVNTHDYKSLYIKNTEEQYIISHLYCILLLYNRNDS